MLVHFGPLRVVGSESVTVDDTSGGVALTPATFNPTIGPDASFKAATKTAFISVEDHPIRVNLNPGVTVTASANGHELGDGDAITIEGLASITNFRAIRTTASSATIRVTYYA